MSRDEIIGDCRLIITLCICGADMGIRNNTQPVNRTWEEKPAITWISVREIYS